MVEPRAVASHSTSCMLNYIVAIYLIVVGVIGLNGMYHFIS